MAIAVLMFQCSIKHACNWMQTAEFHHEDIIHSMSYLQAIHECLSDSEKLLDRQFN